MFTVQQIDHVALTVRDVERSVAWYQDILGLERRHQEVWGHYPAVVYAGTTGIALFPAAEPLQHTEEDPKTTRGMRHLAFRVDRANFASAQEDLSARGIPFNFEHHVISRSIYFRDLDGYEIEITTYEL